MTPLELGIKEGKMNTKDLAEVGLVPEGFQLHVCVYIDIHHIHMCVCVYVCAYGM